MPTFLGIHVRNFPSPLIVIVASYIGLRSLEIAFRPQEAFRTRTAHRVMTLFAVGLFVAAVLFVAGEILRAIGVIALPWTDGPPAAL